MLATSPKSSSLAKLGLHSPKPKTFKVLIIGHSGVGKTAMVVRFITRRFIGSYDNTEEKVYTFTTIIDGEIITFEISDRPGHFNTADADFNKTTDHSKKDTKDFDVQVKWADAFILVYSVTDKCSFDECNRLKFLINYSKRKRKLTQKESFMEIPVVLVGNKNDQFCDRMVTPEEGYRRSKEMNCVSFHEISTRENADQVVQVFQDITRYWRVFNKSLKLKRSTSDSQTSGVVDSVSSNSYSLAHIGNNHQVSPSNPATYTKNEKRMSIMIFGRFWTENRPDEVEETEDDKTVTPFRDRACTDGTLFSRPRRWRIPPPQLHSNSTSRADRRMSISLRGSNSNASY